MSTSEKRVTSDEVASKLKDYINGKTVLITGTSPGGLGAETARAIATQNPGMLILAGRSRAAIEETEKNIKRQVPTARTRILIIDLANLSSVREAAAQVNAYSETVDVLINNAAIMAGPYEKTVDGHESQFQVNHLGHFLFTNLLMGKMASKGARVVNVTSNGYGFGGIRWDDPDFEKDDYNKWAAYAQSKTANILFSSGLAERLGGKGVYSYSVEVGGGIHTKLGKYLTPEDMALLAQYPIPIITPAEGTATQVAAAFDPSFEAHNGAFLEHCRPSETKEEWSWARGNENVDKLWALSERMVGQKFTY